MTRATLIFMYIGGVVFGLGLAFSGAARPEVVLSFLHLVISQISGTESNGDQEYNSLQANLRRRMTKGLLFQAA